MPPASTTPALARTGSMSGVRLERVAALGPGRLEHLERGRRRPRRRAVAPSAASRTTVRIVPSTGRVTAS